MTKTNSERSRTPLQQKLSQPVAFVSNVKKNNEKAVRETDKKRITFGFFFVLFSTKSFTIENRMSSSRVGLNVILH